MTVLGEIIAGISVTTAGTVLAAAITIGKKLDKQSEDNKAWKHRVDSNLFGIANDEGVIVQPPMSEQFQILGKQIECFQKKNSDDHAQTSRELAKLNRRLTTTAAKTAASEKKLNVLLDTLVNPDGE